MLFGPIFSADVVTSGRRARYFWVRTGYAALVLLLLGFCYAPNWEGDSAPTIQSTANLATAFFMSFSLVQITAVLLLGPAFTAGSIATERERRTIEYLFATDLSNIEIVYGKFAAALLRMFVFLIVSLPILALARLLGGIAYDRMLAVFVVTVSTAVTIVAVSIAISVWSPRARDAVIRTYLCLFGAVVLPLMVAGLFAGIASALGAPGSGLGRILVKGIEYFFGIALYANPYVVIMAIVTQDFSNVTVNTTFGLWGTVGVLVGEHALLTLVCAILAPWGVRRVHLKASGKGAVSKIKPAIAQPLPVSALEVAPGPASLTPGLLQELDATPAAALVENVAIEQSAPYFRPRWRREVSEDRPMLWKEIFAEKAYSRLGCLGRGVMIAALTVIVIATLFGFVQYLDSSWDSGAEWGFIWFAGMMSTLVVCGSCLLLAARGATSITGEKERDTWLALLSTPLEPSEIIWAKFWGTLYTARWLVPLLGFFWLLCVVVAPTFVLGLPFIVGSLVILTAFFTAVGVAFSLRSPNSTRSLGMTLVVCVILGGGYYLCCGCLMSPLFFSGPGGEHLVALMLAPWPPYLSFAPYMTPLLLEDNNFLDGGSLVVGYVLGCFGYLVATGVIMAATINGFDQAVGRRNDYEWAPDNRGSDTVPTDSPSNAVVDAAVIPPTGAAEGGLTPLDRSAGDISVSDQPND